jgi:hypothetical protein
MYFTTCILSTLLSITNVNTKMLERQQSTLFASGWIIVLVNTSVDTTFGLLHPFHHKLHVFESPIGMLRSISSKEYGMQQVK